MTPVSDTGARSEQGVRARHTARGMTRVAVLGAGTVGTQVVTLLQAVPKVDIVGVLVRDPEKPRDFRGWRDLVTVDRSVIDDADVVVEVMGGVGEAGDLALDALRAGARVVSANKAALAERWSEFAPFLSEGRVYLEAAVMAGVPVIGPLTGALRGCAPVALHAVLNGTCNVILSAMEEGVEYADALADAQVRGYAEADPTLDVGGYDAAHKLSLLARLAFDPDLEHDDVKAGTRGISDVTRALVAEQTAKRRSVRLIGSIVPRAGAWRAVVRPVSLPSDHPLVTGGPTNTMLFTGDPLGDVLMRGPGAGGGATASAVVGDVLAALAGAPGHRPVAAARAVPEAYDDQNGGEELKPS